MRSFQISAVFPHLTALENVRLALQRARGASFDFWRSERVLDVYNDRARELLYDVGPDRRTPTRWSPSCPTAASARWRSPPRWRWIPEMMLLDEPTAGMAHDDVAPYRRADPPGARGAHHPDGGAQPSVVEGLCDTITVLTRGRVLAEGDYATVSKNPEVIAAYLGTPRCLRCTAGA